MENNKSFINETRIECKMSYKIIASSNTNLVICDLVQNKYGSNKNEKSGEKVKYNSKTVSLVDQKTVA